MTILIEKEQDLNNLRFKEEILTKGEIKFYKKNKIEIIKCVDKNITPETYNCILLSGKNIFIIMNIFFRILTFHKRNEYPRFNI